MMRSAPDDGAFGDIRGMALWQLLMPPVVPRFSNVVPRQSPNLLVEGIFVLATDSDGNLDVAKCWPAGLRGSRLETTLIRQSICPGPVTFYAPHPNGFAGRPVVLSLLDTMRDEEAEIGDELYACVTGAPDGMPKSQVFCLVSKVPLYAFHFNLLRLLSRCGSPDTLWERIANTGLDKNIIADGVTLADSHESPLPLSLSIPELPGSSLRLEALGSPAHFSQWQAAWGLEGIVEQWPELVGEYLVRLLVHVLLEQKVLLLGEAQKTCRLAIALKRLLWPFRWLHLFTTAPLPQGSCPIPFQDAPFPMIVSLPCLPPQTARSSDLPSGITGADLSGTFVQWPRSRGGKEMKWPGGCRIIDQLNDVTRKLQSRRMTSAVAAQTIHRLFSAQISILAGKVKSYVEHMVESSRPITTDECLMKANNRDAFVRWVDPPRADIAFYESFFETQMCLDLLDREIVLRTSDEAVESPAADRQKARSSQRLSLTAGCTAVIVEAPQQKRQWRCSQCIM